MVDIPVKPEAIMLIGLPGAGKTTWAESYLTRKDYQLISTDLYIEAIASCMGKTYGDIFKSTIDTATKWMENRLKLCLEAHHNLVWDQTNLTTKSRARKLGLLREAGYNVTAVAFELDTDELERRRKQREVASGKSIAPSVLESMGKTYVRPTRLEGFSKIIIVSPHGEIEYAG